MGGFPVAGVTPVRLKDTLFTVKHRLAGLRGYNSIVYPSGSRT